MADGTELLMAEPKEHLLHYRDGERMALCGRRAFGRTAGCHARSQRRRGVVRHSPLIAFALRRPVMDPPVEALR